MGPCSARFKVRRGLIVGGIAVYQEKEASPYQECRTTPSSTAAITAVTSPGTLLRHPLELSGRFPFYADRRE